MTSPLLALSACFALGIVAADAPHGSLPGTILRVPLLLAFAGLCMLAGLVLVRARREVLAWLLALAGFVFSGAAAARLFEFRFPPHHLSHLEDLGSDLKDPVRISGRLVSSPLETPSSLQFDLELTEIEDQGRIRPLTGKVRLRLRRAQDPQSAEVADSLRLGYGDSIRALAGLQRPRVYRDPGVFDFRRWMETIEDIYRVGTIKSPLLVEKLSRQGSPELSSLLERARGRLLAGIDRLYPPWSVEGPDGAVLKAVLLGDRSSLDSDTVENFRKTGLYHLLVISGLHVGLLAMLAALFLRLFALGESWRSALVLLFLLGYGALVEQRAPTLRATLMIAAYLVARFFYRQHAALNAVGLAALLLLIHRPAWLFESGFELSFAAALLIVGLVVPILGRTTEPYRRALRDVNEVGLDVNFRPRQAQLRLDVRRVVGRLETRFPFMKNHPPAATAVVTFPLRALVWTVNILLFSAILQMGLMLPMAETFHRVTYAGIGLNALAIPVMTVLLGLALPTVLLGVVSPAVAAWPAKILALVMSGLFALTDLPHLPAWLSYRVPSPPAWVAWGFALSIVAAAWALGRHPRLFWTLAAGLAVFAALISLRPFAPRLPSARLEVTALDCGAGNAVFIVLPDRTTLLVGAGGARGHASSDNPFQARRWDAGEDIVSPYLWSRGIKKLDVVVMGHGSESQLASLAAIARNFRIGEFWYGANRLNPSELAFLDELRRLGIRLRAVGAGDRIARGSTSIQILWPPGGRDEEITPRNSSNGDSVTMRISDGERSVLLPGEISGQAERAWVDSGVPLESRLLVLAGPDSSLRLSPDFLVRIKPRVALLSGTDDDSRELPSPEGLAGLRAAGARVFRTGSDGAVTVEMRETTISVHASRMPAGDGAFGLAATGSGEPSSPSVR